LTQIYEVTTPEMARAVSRIGVDHVGAKVGDGARPRELTVAEALRVKGALEAGSRFVSLFMDHDVGRIAGWIAAVAPDIAHFGAAPDRLEAEHVARLKHSFPGTRMMRSIPMVGEESLALALAHDGVADFLMLDSVRASDGKFGAVGATHDWRLSRRIVEAVRCPVLLAGGLGPDNVAEAIRAVRPAGVDSKTKTDVDGGHEKDLGKVRAYHLAAKAALG
jgi:phosphoribosylanthranilate isomerase